MLWITTRFPLGSFVTSDKAGFQYEFTDFYGLEYERLIYWAYLSLMVSWPLKLSLKPRVSEGDNAGNRFQTLSTTDY